MSEEQRDQQVQDIREESETQNDKQDEKSLNEQNDQEVSEPETETDQTVEDGSTEDEVDQPSVEELMLKLESAEQRAEENYQRLLRSQADFENLKRRTQQERETQAKYASLPLIEKLLPVLDNFERALRASKETQDAESLAKGVEMVFKQVEEVLAGEGLVEIPTVGEKFDPNVHQAVMQEDSEEYESGVVTEEFQKGYKLKDKVIRPAMVKVSS